MEIIFRVRHVKLSLVLCRSERCLKKNLLDDKIVNPDMVTKLMLVLESKIIFITIKVILSYHLTATHIHVGEVDFQSQSFSGPVLF